MCHVQLLKGLCFLPIILTLSCTSQPDSFSWDDILESEDSRFEKVIENKDKFELQIRYTQIDRDAKNYPQLTSHNYNVDTSAYFYPASTIKMPVSFLALQRMNELVSEGYVINRNTAIVHDSLRISQSKAVSDFTNQNNLPSIAQYINKVFVVSDNDAYNRLYEFLGQDYINNELKKKAVFTNSRIVTRVGVGVLPLEENKHTNQVRFLDENGHNKGLGFYDDHLDSIIMKPFDMSQKNFINIIDLEAGLLRVIFPEIFQDSEKFNLGDEDYKFLYQSMSKYPSDYAHLRDDPNINYDGFVKFFIFGDSKEDIPEHIQIYNKVGYAYGYLTDCAYIFDTKNNVEFFLTATILVNENQIFNDGKYEYDDVGVPFLAELGKKIYDYELQRKRVHAPDLSKYIIE